MVEAASLRAVPQASMALTAWAESQAADGDLASAMDTLDEVMIVRQRNPGLSPWPTFYHLLATARVTTTAGDLPRAEQLLDEAARQMARFSDGMDAMHARLADARADTAAAAPRRAGLGALDRARGRRTAPAAEPAELERDRRRALPHPQHGEDPRPGGLPQAGRQLALRGGTTRSAASADLISAPASRNLTRVRSAAG